jgi:hypothetical protein
MDKNWFINCSQVNVHLPDGVTSFVLEAAIRVFWIYFMFWFSDRILSGRLATVKCKYSCLFDTKQCGHVLVWKGAGEGIVSVFDVHGSVHRNTNLIERTDKMQPCSRIYYSNVS